MKQENAEVVFILFMFLCCIILASLLVFLRHSQDEVNRLEQEKTALILKVQEQHEKLTGLESELKYCYSNWEYVEAGNGRGYISKVEIIR